MMKVKLLKPHTHGDVKFDTGMELDVSESDANWLINLQVAAAVDVKTTPATKVKTEES